jgi:uncharacterized protein with PIN domain
MFDPVGKILGGKDTSKNLKCTFCQGTLSDIVERQKHDNPEFAEFKTCMNCGHQWAKRYWPWLKEQEEK